MKRAKGSNWNQMYGSIRRAKDRKLLQELERQIEAEEAWNPDTAPTHQITEEMRLKIASAYGRPLN